MLERLLNDIIKLVELRENGLAQGRNKKELWMPDFSVYKYLVRKYPLCGYILAKTPSIANREKRWGGYL